MKRIDLQPTEDNLVRLIKDDPIKRNAELIELVRLLCGIEGPFTIFLDSGWGSGKTIFVKQLELVLACLNPNLETPDNNSVLEYRLPDLREIIGVDSFLPVYYNAWEQDYWADPLPSIAQQLAGSAQEYGGLRGSISDSEALFTILDSVLKPFGLDSARDIKEVLTGRDLLEQFHVRQELRERIAELIDHSLAGRANKLLLIIDELDRCKPTFAVRVLEEVRSLFDDDRVIVLAAINMPELSRTVEGLYGTGFDGSRYLSRFYDLKLALRTPDTEAYLRAAGFGRSTEIDKAIAKEMIDALDMSMRDVNRYMLELRDAESKGVTWPTASGFGSAPISCARYCILPVLLAVRISNQETYQSIRENWRGDLLLGLIQKSNKALTSFDRAWEECIPKDCMPGTESEIGEMRIRVANAYLTLFWDVNTDSRTYLDAYNLLLGEAFGVTNLKFISQDILR